MFGRRLFDYVVKYVHEESDADDILQEWEQIMGSDAS